LLAAFGNCFPSLVDVTPMTTIRELGQKIVRGELPAPADVRCHKRLGGFLKHYSRKAA
jgi:hypothetical protein